MQKVSPPLTLVQMHMKAFTFQMRFMNEVCKELSIQNNAYYRRMDSNKPFVPADQHRINAIWNRMLTEMILPTTVTL